MGLDTIGLGLGVVGSGLHSGEEEHLLDVVRIGHEHHQSVDAQTPSAGGRQAVLECREEALVLEHGLVIARRLVLGLRIKALPLHEGVVELGVGVTELLAAHEDLETLRAPRDAAVVLGERRHDLGVIAQEGRGDKGGLEVLADQLVNQPRRGARRGAKHLAKLLLLLCAQVVEELAAFLRRVVLGDLPGDALRRRATCEPASARGRAARCRASARRQSDAGRQESR
jgi:hypothetical protein